MKKKSNKRKTRSRRCSGLPQIENDLFNQLISLTGIPADSIRNELNSILDRKNIDIKKITLDQLRSVVASYLREIMGSILDRHGKKI